MVKSWALDTLLWKCSVLYFAGVHKWVWAKSGTQVFFATSKIEDFLILLWYGSGGHVLFLIFPSKPKIRSKGMVSNMSCTRNEERSLWTFASSAVSTCMLKPSGSNSEYSTGITKDQYTLLWILSMWWFINKQNYICISLDSGVCYHMNNNPWI